MPTARPVTARMSVSRAAAPKIGLTRPVLVGQPLVSLFRSKVSWKMNDETRSLCYYHAFCPGSGQKIIRLMPDCNSCGFLSGDPVDRDRRRL
jgi:hypothetical protein